MQTPQGIVVSLAGDGTARRAYVEVDIAAVCPRCAAGRGCGAGLLGSRSGSRRIDVSIAADSNLKPGDNVRLALAPRNVLRAAGLVYGWPLTGAALATLLAYAANLGDRGAAIAALSGLAFGVALARHRIRQSRCLEDFTPELIG